MYRGSHSGYNFGKPYKANRLSVNVSKNVVSDNPVFVEFRIYKLQRPNIIVKKRFVHPYKRYVVAAFVFNVLGALFGAFQFATIQPVWSLYFRARRLVFFHVQLKS